jgi:hypothetical protein
MSASRVDLDEPLLILGKLIERLPFAADFASKSGDGGKVSD